MSDKHCPEQGGDYKGPPIKLKRLDDKNKIHIFKDAVGKIKDDLQARVGILKGKHGGNYFYVQSSSKAPVINYFMSRNQNIIFVAGSRMFACVRECS